MQGHPALTTPNLLTELRRQGIPVVESGRNIRQGNIGMKCPFCGPADTSHHMSINVEEHFGVWACWRAPSHSGGPHNIYRLLYQLGVPPGPARALAAQVSAFAGPRASTKRALRRADAKPLQMKGIIPIGDKPPKAWRARYDAALDYLTERWDYMNDDDVESVASEYGMVLWREEPGRIVTPVTEDGEWVNYVARASVPARLRYMTYGGAKGRPLGETLFNLDRLLLGGDNLVVCEGLFDAVSVAYLHPGVVATATFGVGVSDTQVELLRLAGEGFRKRFVLFDDGAEAQGMNLAWRIGGKFVACPYEDPEGHVFECLNQ